MAETAHEPEFGHQFGLIQFKDGASMRWDYWGEGPFALTTPDGRQHWFEDCDRFGPTRLNVTGEVSNRRPWAERNPFWKAHEDWCKGGRRVADDGVTCLIGEEASRVAA